MVNCAVAHFCASCACRSDMPSAVAEMLHSNCRETDRLNSNELTATIAALAACGVSVHVRGVS